MEKQLNLFSSRYDEIRQAFLNYDKLHPEVWKLFKKFTFDVIERGFKNYSAVFIIQQIRWHTDKPNVDGSSTFKINNNYIPFYARRFMLKYPTFKGFFRIREQISRKMEPVNRPELTPKDFPYVEE